jgi:hypothetical protein
MTNINDFDNWMVFLKFDGQNQISPIVRWEKKWTLLNKLAYPSPPALPSAYPVRSPGTRSSSAPRPPPAEDFLAAASMGGAAISSHGLACAPPATVPLNPRAQRLSAAGHRSSPQLLLRCDLPAPAVLCRARSQSSSSSNVVSAGGAIAPVLVQSAVALVQLRQSYGSSNSSGLFVRRVELRGRGRCGQAARGFAQTARRGGVQLGSIPGCRGRRWRRVLVLYVPHRSPFRLLMLIFVIIARLCVVCPSPSSWLTKGGGWDFGLEKKVRLGGYDLGR